MKSFFREIQIIVIVLLGIFCFNFGGHANAFNTALTTRDNPIRTQVNKNYGKLPLSFEANQGQTDNRVDFLAHGKGYSLFLNQQEAVLALKKPSYSTTMDNDINSIERIMLRMKLIGASPKSMVKGIEKLPGKNNYFVGNDPKKWHINIPSYEKVRYYNVYPGLDLIYYGNQGQLEYDFIVNPGADPTSILLSFDGTKKILIDDSGGMILFVNGGKVLLRKPYIYQEVSGLQQEITGRYVLKNKNQVAFQLAEYDTSKPLVIDPVLVYSTYLGGSDSESANGITIDANGNIYITGSTSSYDFPTTVDIPQPTNPDLFVAKLNTTGDALIYSTYLGGSNADGAAAITVDASGNAYIAGSTISFDFPTTEDAFQRTFGGGTAAGDGFITKLNSSGTELIYSTYLGGYGDDTCRDIAIDSLGSAYVTGDTGNTIDNNFPITSGAFMSDPDYRNVFATKLSADGSHLIYSTFLGSYYGYGITVDSNGNACIVGMGAGIPTTENAFQRTFGGGNSDGFVTKLNSSGTDLIYSTYLGGSDSDNTRDIIIDSYGNLIVSGETYSDNFPVKNAIQSSFGGARDAFVAKIDDTKEGLDSLIYSTYLGGSLNENASGIALNAADEAYVTGSTQSFDFPTTEDAFQPVFGNDDYFTGYDGFVTKLDSNGLNLVYSTYFGGTLNDVSLDIAVDLFGDAYISGFTSSTDFPTKNPIQTSLKGGPVDAFVAKIDFTNDFPVALADGPFLGIENVPVTIDASASYDPEGGHLIFSWEFGDGSTLETTEAIINHIYENGGNYNLTLTVNDGELYSLPFSTDANISSTGGGGRSDVDSFLVFQNPSERSTDLPAGTKDFGVNIIYGPTIDPSTFQAFLNREAFTGFNPVPATNQTVTIELFPGRNTLILQIDGVRSDGRLATDRDRLVFIVK